MSVRELLFPVDSNFNNDFQSFEGAKKYQDSSNSKGGQFSTYWLLRKDI